MISYILSAGVVIVRTGELRRFLLLRAFGYWDFPKGEVGSGEDPLLAAKREVLEETTLATLDFKWGEQFLETEPYGKGKVARYYVARYVGGQVALPVNPGLGRPEHHEYRWVRFDQGLALLVPRLARVLRWVETVVGEGR